MIRYIVEIGDANVGFSTFEQDVKEDIIKDDFLNSNKFYRFYDALFKDYVNQMLGYMTFDNVMIMFNLHVKKINGPIIYDLKWDTKTYVCSTPDMELSCKVKLVMDLSNSIEKFTKELM
jgi:hypothetical protein